MKKQVKKGNFQIGVPLASVLLSMVSSILILQGCLVTETLSFDEEQNFIPTIQVPSTVEHPLDEPIILNLDDEAENILVMNFNVFDENTSQLLYYNFLIDGDERLLGAEAEIFPSGKENPVRNVEDVVVSHPRFETLGCHHLELRVTGGFNFANSSPVEENDFSSVSWWVFVISEAAQTVDPLECFSR